MNSSILIHFMRINSFSIVDGAIPFLDSDAYRTAFNQKMCRVGANVTKALKTVNCVNQVNKLFQTFFAQLRLVQLVVCVTGRYSRVVVSGKGIWYITLPRRYGRGKRSEFLFPENKGQGPYFKTALREKDAN